MTRATVSGISIQSVLLWPPSRTDQVPLPTTVNTFCLFVFVDGRMAIYAYICYIYVIYMLRVLQLQI